MMAIIMSFYRVLKILGCKHGCHDHLRPQHKQSGVGSHVPTSTTETLRNRGVALLSRLLWYDKKQFRHFVASLVDSRDLAFLMPFLHGYLGFCADPNNPFSTNPLSSLSSSNNAVPVGSGHPSMFIHYTLGEKSWESLHFFSPRERRGMVTLLILLARIIVVIKKLHKGHLACVRA